MMYFQRCGKAIPAIFMVCLTLAVVAQEVSAVQIPAFPSDVRVARRARRLSPPAATSVIPSPTVLTEVEDDLHTGETTGSLCTCKVQALKSLQNGEQSVQTIVDVSCRSAAGKANFLSVCDCHGVIQTTCPSDYSGTKSITLNAFNSHYCDGVANTMTGRSTRTGSCQGPACPDQGYKDHTKETRTFAENVTYSEIVTCTRMTERTPCTTSGACDCLYGDWGDFTPCSKSCGTGSKTRTRNITRPASNGGFCPTTTDTQACTLQVCPTDCLLGSWGAWSECSAKCGDGIQTRSKPTLVWPRNGGELCGNNTESRTCTGEACPKDCELTKWSDWSSCNKTCGGGYQTSHRNITKGAEHGGECGETTRIQPCNTAECPVDCVLSDWSAWTACSASCNGGNQTRTKKIEVTPQFGGKECNETKQVQDCGISPCPVDCVMGDWSDWSPCPVTCDKGTITRTREVATHGQFGGLLCDSEPRIEYDECNTNVPCPCELGNWSDWTECDKTCGPGVQTRTRPITSRGTVPLCGEQEQQRVCQTMACPSPCVQTNWSEWTTCSRSCNGGTRTRRRTTIKAAVNMECGPTQETEFCNFKPCSQDCVLTNWSDWSDCNANCGGGLRQRHRLEKQAAANGGALCNKKLIQPEDCNTQLCAPACKGVFGPWSKWTDCTKKCGGGTMRRTRSTILDIPPDVSCGLKEQFLECNVHPCPVDCVLGNWSAWSECPDLCLPDAPEEASQTRTRPVSQSAKHGGKACDAMTESRPCPQPACPVDCNVSDWTPWSNCTAECNGGLMTRTRKIITKPINFGAECGALQEDRECNTHGCKVDCELSVWSNFSTCSKPCGGGWMQRVRRVVVNASNGGLPCNSTNEERECNSHPCDKDCVMSDWTDWGPCSEECGGGASTRTRKMVTPAVANGKPCNTSIETKECNSDPCPQCKLGDWTNWTECTASCLGGTQTRTRKVIQKPHEKSPECESTTETRECNNQQCPVDCKVGEWGPWSNCTEECGGGNSNRTRKTVTPAAHGGKACPHLVEYKECNDKPCPVNCLVGEWTPWSQCTKECGEGDQFRTRALVQPAAHAGEECPPLNQSRACNTQECARTCEVDEWTEWTKCSATCNGGDQQRTRKTKWITLDTVNGSKPCPHTIEHQECNQQTCKAKCTIGEWGPWTKCSSTCGGGLQTRKRQVKVEGGEPDDCGPAEETRICGVNECPENCVMGEWEPFSECSASCGASGHRISVRTIIKQPRFGGDACGPTQKEEPCDLKPCPIDCLVSPWSRWSACNKACAGGHKDRTRRIVRQPQHGGLACPHTYEEASCNPHACPRDCLMGDWSAWTPCTATCGTEGQQIRTRKVRRREDDGGKSCPPLKEKRRCNQEPCPIQCRVSKWSDWSDCSKSCGTGGKRQRIRNVLVKGVNCPKLVDIEPCDKPECDKPDKPKCDKCTCQQPDPCPCVSSCGCEFGQWEEWSPCQRACQSPATGVKRRVSHPTSGNCQPRVHVSSCQLSLAPHQKLAKAKGSTLEGSVIAPKNTVSAHLVRFMSVDQHGPCMHSHPSITKETANADEEESVDEE